MVRINPLSCVLNFTLCSVTMVARMDHTGWLQLYDQRSIPNSEVHLVPYSKGTTIPVTDDTSARVGTFPSNAKDHANLYPHSHTPLAHGDQVERQFHILP
jgi:hypothetical protein